MLTALSSYLCHPRDCGTATDGHSPGSLLPEFGGTALPGASLEACQLPSNHHLYRGCHCGCLQCHLLWYVFLLTSVRRYIYSYCFLCLEIPKCHCIFQGGFLHMANSGDQGWKLLLPDMSPIFLYSLDCEIQQTENAPRYSARGRFWEFSPVRNWWWRHWIQVKFW